MAASVERKEMKGLFTCFASNYSADMNLAITDDVAMQKRRVDRVRDGHNPIRRRGQHLGPGFIPSRPVLLRVFVQNERGSSGR